MFRYCSPQNGNALYTGDSTTLTATGTHGATTTGNTNFDDATFNAFDGTYVGRLIKIGSNTIRTILSVTTSSRVVYSGASIATSSNQTWYVGGPVQLPSQFTAANLTAGDEVHIEKTDDLSRITDLTGANASALFTNGSPTITFTTAITQDIFTCEVAMTADNGSTVGTSTTRKQGSFSTSVTTSTTPQLRSHFTTAALDLSNCTRVGFWILSTVNQAASTQRLDLCSDTAGLTPVHSITIPFAMNANVWYLMVYDNGAALSSTVNSVALTTLAGIAAGTTLLDNIIAGNGLMQGDWITKDSATAIDSTTDGRYQVRSIAGGTTAITERGMSTGINVITSLGYVGTTATVAAYAQRPYSLQTLTTGFTLPINGTSTSAITWKGGYDFSSDTQTGETVWGLQTSGTALVTMAQWNTMERVHSRGGNLVAASTGNILRAAVTGCTGGANVPAFGGINGLSGNYAVLHPYFVLGCSNTQGCSFSASVTIVEGGKVHDCNQGIQALSSNCVIYITGDLTSSNHSNNGIFHTSSNVWDIAAGVTLTANWGGNSPTSQIVRGAGSLNFNGSVGVAIAGEIGRIIGATTFSIGNNSYTALRVGSCSSTLTITWSSATGYENSYIAVGKYNDTAGDYRVFSPLGTMQTDTGTTHGGASVSWKLTPTALATASFPFKIPVQALAVDNTATSITLYVKRTNSAHVAGIMYAGDLIGQPATVLAPDTGTFNNWNAVTINVGAGSDATGAFQLYLYAYGNTGAVYISKL